MYIQFRKGDFGKNREVEEGIIIDFAEDGSMLGIEILEVNSRFTPEELSRVDIRMPLHLVDSV